MTLMYLTAEGFDTPNPNNQLAMTMIDDFLKAGIGVYMVASRRKRINPDIPGILKDREGFTYDIIDRPVVDKTKLIERYLEEMRHAFSAMKSWRKHRRDVDIVLLQSCPTVLVSMVLLKLFLRKPIVFSIFDVFPGSAYDIGVIRNRPTYDLLELLQQPVYRMSTRIVVDCADMKTRVMQLGVPEDKVCIVAHWYDDNSVVEVPIEENRFIKKYGIDTTKFYVQFAGTIGYVLDYQMIIQVADLLREEADIVFQIIGDGNTKEQFVKEAAEMRLSNIVFYPLQPLEMVPDIYSACSICLIPLKKGVIGTAFPSKSVLLMACRRVVLNAVEENSDYFRMFNENNIGLSVSNSHPEKVAEAIRYLHEHPQKVNEMANNAKDYGERFFSRKVNTVKFIDLFKELYAKSDCRSRE